MVDIERYIRTETRFSIVGSVAVTMLFYGLAFGLGGDVRIGGIGGYAFDFIPQSFMTALICTWLPGVITRKRVQQGVLGNMPAHHTSLVLTGLFAGSITLLVGGGSAIGVLFASGATSIDWGLGLAIKGLFAALVAIIITPFGLRRLLARK